MFELRIYGPAPERRVFGAGDLEAAYGPSLGVLILPSPGVMTSVAWQ